MGETTNINLSIDNFIVTSVTKINWDEAKDTWGAFYGSEYYAKYLKAVYFIDVPGPPYKILWDHAIILTVVFPAQGGGSYVDPQTGKKKRKKTIKILFIMDDLTKVFEKDKNDEISVEFRNQVENELTERFGQKVILEDVQIIHR
jgi:hypothetical protein